MLFWENESRFLIKFLINANQTKLKYSLLTSSFNQCGNKDVIIYPGASVSEFIRAIRSFISIDSWTTKSSEAQILTHLFHASFEKGG